MPRARSSGSAIPPSFRRTSFSAREPRSADKVVADDNVLGLEPDPALVRHGLRTGADAACAAADPMRCPEPPTAVFTTNAPAILGDTSPPRDVVLLTPSGHPRVGRDRP